MPEYIAFRFARAGLIAGALLVIVQFCAAEPGAKAAADDEDYRVLSMGSDPAEKGKAGAAAADDWDELIKANNYDKLTKNGRQLKKAELAEDFDADSLDAELQFDWYGAAEECAAKGRLPTHRELLNIWESECRESTSTACSAVYWTSEKKGERALGVNFLNGYVVPKDLDGFAYVRCVGKPERKNAAARPAAADPGRKKGGGTTLKVIELVRNYRPLQDGPRVDEKLAVMIAGAGGSYGAINWEVKKKGPGVYSAAAVVPVGEGDIRFTFSANLGKKTVTPLDARAKAVFKAIIDPDIADGGMR